MTRRGYKASLAAIEHDICQQRQRAYARARAHSRLVRFLRRALPLGALMLFGVFMLASFNLFTRESAEVDISGLQISAGEVAMENPRVQGTSSSGQGYDIVAVRAFQSLADPQTVRFEQVKGKITDSDGATTEVAAREGLFRGSEESVTLTGNVVIARPNGDRMQADRVVVNLDSGTMQATGTVRMQTANGNMAADRMSVDESGDKVSFEGPVRMLMHYRAEDHSKQQGSRP